MTTIAAHVRAWPRLATRAAGWVGAAVRTVPGIAGAGLIAYGAGLVYRPALFVVGGVFLLLVDRRVP